jgi:DnaJ-domain-containing protein 1
MFDRQRTSVNAQSGRAPVNITLREGEAVRAEVKLPMSGRIGDAMNNADQFLDLLMADGSQLFLAKHTVKSVTPIDVPKADHLQKRQPELAVFDPYTVLGIARDTAPDAIRSAYHTMVKAYHPDRLANADLPKEMRDYAAAMLIRINLAYEQIGA